jgi:hypothetical protein
MDQDDPFACFGSSDSENDDEDARVQNENEDERVKHNVLRGRRLQTAANARRANASLVHLPLFSNDFEVYEDVNRGKGLRALRSYKCGDEIMREGAAMRVTNVYAASTEAQAKNMFEKAVHSVFDALPEATQACVMNLSCCNQHFTTDGDATLVGMYQTNSFQLGAESDSGLFLTAARMNHSCRPNANHFWRPDLQKTLVFATRDIYAGQEICNTYGPSECMKTQERRKHLNDRFSFECMCEMCCEGNTIGGDDRMAQIKSLHENVSLCAASGKAEEAIQCVDECLKLLKEQGIGSGVFTKPLLHYGYQIALTKLQDNVMARLYLEHELVAVTNSEGHGSDRAVDIERALEEMNSR